MRVLCLNNLLIGEACATGVTLKNIFSGMKDVEILQCTLFPGISGKETFEGTLVETISNRKTNPLNRFIYDYHRKSLQGERAGGNSRKSSQKSKIKARIKTAALFWNELIPVRIDRGCMERIRGFSPDVIYTLGADINVLKNAVKLSDTLGIPIVLHTMDDLYHTKFAGRSPLQRYARRKLRGLYQKAYQRSRRSIAIGPKMAEEYEKEFRLPFAWAMNCADGEESGVAPEEGLLLFSGGLHGGRGETLEELARVLEGTDKRLEIYTDGRNYAANEARFAGFCNTSLRLYVPREQMLDNLSRASVLLHVESFEKQYIEYFRLSMSTKLPECLVAKRPILCIGPREIGTVAYINSTGIGRVAESVAEAPACLAALLSEREAITARIGEVFRRDFRRSDVQEKVRGVLEYHMSGGNEA